MAVEMAVCMLHAMVYDAVNRQLTLMTYAPGRSSRQNSPRSVVCVVCSLPDTSTVAAATGT